MTELAGFYLGDSLLAFPIIPGVAPFHTSYSKILGIVITVGALNLVLQRERRCPVGDRGAVGMTVYNKPIR